MAWYHSEKHFEKVLHHFRTPGLFMQMMDPVETLGGCLKPIHGNPVRPSVLQIDDDAFVPFAVADTADPMGFFPLPFFFFSLSQEIGCRYDLKLFHGSLLSRVTGTVPVCSSLFQVQFQFRSGLSGVPETVPVLFRIVPVCSGFERTSP
jgi:hypothetical protein